MDFELTDDQHELQTRRTRGRRGRVPAVARPRRRRRRRHRRRRRPLEDLRAARLAHPHRPRGRRRHGLRRGRARHHARGAGSRRRSRRPFLVTTSQYVPLIRNCGDADATRGQLLGAVCAGDDRHGHVRARRPPGRAGRRRVADRGDVPPRAWTATAPTSWRSWPAPTTASGCSWCPRDDVIATRTARRSTRPSISPTSGSTASSVGPGRSLCGPTVAAGSRRHGSRRVTRSRRDHGRCLATDPRARLGPRALAPPVRGADRVVPGGQAHAGRRLHRHRAGPGVVRTSRR